MKDQLIILYLKGQCIVSGAMQSCTCKIIIKRSFIRIQWWKDWNLNVLVSIVRARKVAIYNTIFASEEWSLLNDDSVVCYSLMLHWNRVLLFLVYQLLISIYLHYHFTWKVSLAENETLCSREELNTCWAIYVRKSQWLFNIY